MKIAILKFKYYICVHRWIDSGTEDRKLEVELLPLADIHLPPEPEEDEEEEEKIETSTFNFIPFETLWNKCNIDIKITKRNHLQPSDVFRRCLAVCF